MHNLLSLLEFIHELIVSVVKLLNIGFDSSIPRYSLHLSEKVSEVLLLRDGFRE